MDHLNNDIREELQQELTTRELQDIESALHREYVRKPDVQAEWEKLMLSDKLESPQDDDSSTSGNHTSQFSTINSQLKNTSLLNSSHLWSFLSGVAATAVIFILFTLFYNRGDDNKTYVFSANQNTKEVLLSDGSDDMKVVSDKSLDYQGKPSAPATQQPTPKLLTLTTPRGKDYHVTLADGTEVWMNADSRLEFPKQFTGSQRRVKLKGEAYFQVAKNASKPFIVETDFFNTTVLGTTFNLKAYSAKDANIVLVEGSVRVNAKGHEITLKPGQQAILNSQSSILNIKEVDTYPYTQWREGFFYFENQTLFEIMQELGRWYNVNIAFDDPQKMNLRLHFVCKRSQSLGEAIKNMNELGVVEIEYTGDAVIIK
jgi:ferric-dicitrate binding protein FerR (iron transport regulator)